jgi:hypothetical protein
MAAVVSAKPKEAIKQRAGFAPELVPESKNGCLVRSCGPPVGRSSSSLRSRRLRDAVAKALGAPSGIGAAFLVLAVGAYYRPLLWTLQPVDQTGASGGPASGRRPRRLETSRAGRCGSSPSPPFGIWNDGPLAAPCRSIFFPVLGDVKTQVPVEFNGEYTVVRSNAHLNRFDCLRCFSSFSRMGFKSQTIPSLDSDFDPVWVIG